VGKRSETRGLTVEAAGAATDAAAPEPTGAALEDGGAESADTAGLEQAAEPTTMATMTEKSMMDCFMGPRSS
jgi:hypothetical protein